MNSLFEQGHPGTPPRPARGAWPGDESIEEILDTLNDTLRKAMITGGFFIGYDCHVERIISAEGGWHAIYDYPDKKRSYPIAAWAEIREQRVSDEGTENEQWDMKYYVVGLIAENGSGSLVRADAHECFEQYTYVS